MLQSYVKNKLYLCTVKNKLVRLMKSRSADSAVRIDMLDARQLTAKLIRFALPIVASGIVQQSFNSVDVAVVGQYVGSRALAAVGSNGPVIGLIINLFVGISIGANVVISNYIGQRNHDRVANAVATTMMLSVVSGIILLAVGLLISRPILEMMGTPGSIIDSACLYLRIFSLGFPAMLVYNFGSAVLRSIGDTKRPFYCLVFGGIANIILNLVLVLVFGMGVEGVAVATVVSNIISAAGVVYILTHEQAPVKVVISHLRMFRTELNRILRIGVPAGIQGMVFALSNIFIQSAINSFGPDAVAGSAAALNYELYCYFIISAFAQAAVAFVSQNFGALQYDMCRSVFRRCMMLSVVSCGLLNVVIFIWREPFVGIFTSDVHAISYAAERVAYVLLFQFLASSYEIAGAAMRGIGYSMTPTVLTIFGTCLLRVGWIYITPEFSSFGHLLIIYPVTWSVTGLMVLVAYLVVSRKVLVQRT